MSSSAEAKPFNQIAAPISMETTKKLCDLHVTIRTVRQAMEEIRENNEFLDDSIIYAAIAEDIMHLDVLWTKVMQKRMKKLIGDK